MPQMSMWRSEKGADYRWIDRQVSAMYTAGGTGIGLHKYLGPMTPDDPLLQTPTGDATQPTYTNQSVTNIQDILFLENRDRKYDTNVYVLRGHYQRSDNDFDLSQFGLFLQTGTIIMTFHFNDMIAVMGRKIMNGDVLELFHLKDDYALGIEGALKRFYVAGDCSWASEGFSPLWYPHIWRVKLEPLVDSQEYKDILNNIKATNSSGPMGTDTGTNTVGDLMSTYQKYINVNEAIVQQAEADVPKSGYDVSKIFSFGSDKDGNLTRANLTADNQTENATSDITADAASFSPTVEQNPTGYLTGDGLAPNGLAVSAGVSFPSNPEQGAYHLRLDYLPNRLFRFDGARWTKIEDNVRTNITAGAVDNGTLRNSFANNSNTMVLHNGDVIKESQSLSHALRPKADY